jgi:hypothetical protein
MHASITPGRFNFISFQRIAGNLLFIILAIYAVVYAAERVSYIDSAWQFFCRVNDESFLFPSGRFGVFLSEIPLFIAVKLHLPFSFLVYTFSLSYILLYYLTWRLCTYTLKNPVAGLAILLSSVVGIRESFLHPVTETHQCVVFSCLLWALISYDFKRPWLKTALACALTVFILFVHPIGVFTMGFVLLFFMIDKKAFRTSLPWLILTIILVISLWRFFAPTDPYDADQFAHLKNSGGISALTQSFALSFLKIHFTHFYWLPELALLIAAAALAFRKEWLKLSALIVSVAAYLIIACITFSQGDSSIMLERVFLPAFFMINLAFADLLAKQTRLNKWIPMTLVVFFMVNGIRYVNAGCLMYKKRVVYLDKLIQAGITQGNDKYILPDAKADKERILVPWAFGTETLIYSKFKYDKCISITIENASCPPGNCRVTSMLCLPVKELNQNYFQLSNAAYVDLK